MFITRLMILQGSISGGLVAINTFNFPDFERVFFLYVVLMRGVNAR